MSATKITSPCGITNIDPNDVMILPHDANLCRMEFSEGTRPGCEESGDKAKRTESDRPNANTVDVARAVETRSVDDAEPQFRLKAAIAT
jgi:hypothetical protein